MLEKIYLCLHMYLRGGGPDGPDCWCPGGGGPWYEKACGGGPPAVLSAIFICTCTFV